MRRLLTTVLILLSIKLVGQNTIKLTGTVVSKQGDTLPGVNLYLRNSMISAITDVCGRFTVEIPGDRKGVLILSLISNPIEFNLGNLKTEDLNKEIKLRLMKFSGRRSSKKERKKYDSKYNCRPDAIDTVTYTIE